jgi:hypothetical protein
MGQSPLSSLSSLASSLVWLETSSFTAGGDTRAPREGEKRVLYTRRYAAGARLASRKQRRASARQAGASCPRHAPPPAGPSEVSARARHTPVK